MQHISFLIGNTELPFRNTMTESRSALPAIIDTTSDVACLILLLPILMIMVVIGPGFWLWFIDPWLIIYAIVFYNIPFIILGVCVYRNPENKGLIALWVFQMVTAYLGVLITAPTSSGL